MNVGVNPFGFVSKKMKKHYEMYFENVYIDSNVGVTYDDIRTKRAFVYKVLIYTYFFNRIYKIKNILTI